MLRSRLIYLSLLSIILGITALPANSQTSQQAPAGDPAELPTEDLSDPSNLRPLTQADSILSLQGGQKLMQEAQAAINQEQHDVAAEKLQNARQIFNQLSNFYLQLSSSFSGIENRIADAQRKKALETGQMRDEATYQLALVHRAQDQPELSVPLLIQVIRSQNPTSELGKKSYQQLFEIGFVDTPFSTSNSSQ
ncbi:MAG: hypothetical protein QNJ34_11160 [Xenococcaceae cyanobacterium MO_188.B29]|nr:hypothetical protein [Xenococcaceae cyanobacterium MO_188.B29]